jgi:hypothetical protein
LNSGASSGVGSAGSQYTSGTQQSSSSTSNPYSSSTYRYEKKWLMISWLNYFL